MMYLKYTLGVITACLLVSTLTAQPCDRGISTDPDAPVNPQCPTQVNTFDWRTEMLPVSGNVPTPPGIPPITELRSPFWEDESPSMSFLAEPNYTTYHDFEVEEGWEILFMDMEYRPNKNYVYFILYNKYESFIRVFTTQAQLGSPNNTTAVKARFTSADISAVLSPFLGRSQSLDEESLDEVEMTNIYYQNSFRFTYFDIPVEYDPCTCQSTNPSLSFNFALVNEQELDLYSRYTATEQPLASIVKIDASSRIAPDDFLAGIDGAVAGTSTFKTWEQLTSYYRSLSSEVVELKKEYNRIQAFDKVLSIALKAGGGDALKAIKLVTTTLDIGEDDPLTIKGKEAAELFLGSLNLWGAGVKKRLESAQSQLTALGSTTLTLGEQVTRGTLTGQYSSGGPEFALPGSATDCTDPDNYPLYNEVLGRMALLRKPTVTVQPYATELSETYIRAAQISLDAGSVNYVFNPAAEINEDVTEINALLRIYDLDNEATGSTNLTQINDDPVGFVSPLLPLGNEQKALTARLSLAAQGLGKISPGDRLVIRLDAYPEQEYGTINTRVQHITALPQSNADGQAFYQISAPIAQPLITSYGKHLPTKVLMSGTGKVITAERSLLARVFEQLLSLVETQNL
jgi:hypothetical protein